MLSKATLQVHILQYARILSKILELLSILFWCAKTNMLILILRLRVTSDILYMRMPSMSAHHKKLNIRAKQKQSNSQFSCVSKSRTPRGLKQPCPEISCLCTFICCARCHNCFQKVSFPLVWFLMLYFKLENWNYSVCKIAIEFQFQAQRIKCTICIT